MYSLSGYISPLVGLVYKWCSLTHGLLFFPFPSLPPLTVLLFLLFHHFALSSVSSTSISIFSQMKWLEEEALQRDWKRRLTWFLTTFKENILFFWASFIVSVYLTRFVFAFTSLPISLSSIQSIRIWKEMDTCESSIYEEIHLRFVVALLFILWLVQNLCLSPHKSSL